MVEGMGNAGFFRWLCMRLAKAVHYKTVAIFITFMVMSSILAMFIDSITVILFLAAVTVELAQLLKFNPVPMILSEVFCATSNGNIAKTVAMNVIWFSLGMIIVSQFCPAMTQIAIEQGVNLADYNAAGVSIVSFGVLCHPFIVGLFAAFWFQNYIAIAIIIVVYVVLYVLFKKNRYTFVDWMENQAAKYQL